MPHSFRRRNRQLCCRKAEIHICLGRLRRRLGRPLRLWQPCLPPLHQSLFKRVHPRKVVPLFVDKFVAIARSISSKLKDLQSPPSLLYILSRNLSFFSIDFIFIEDRSSDLGRTKSRQILIFPNSSGLFSTIPLGKCLGVIQRICCP